MSESEPSYVTFVDKDRRRIELGMDEMRISLPLNPIPDTLYNRLAAALDGDEPAIEKIRRIFRSTVFSPIFCTQDPHRPFPLNTANKVVFLTLKDEEIERQIEDLEGQVLALLGRPFEETTEERVKIYRSLYLHDSKIDRMRLGALELYGETTYANVRKDPRFTLSFIWFDDNKEITPRSHAIQLNCVAEIIPRGSMFFRFMRFLRLLFLSKFLDLKQSEYLCAYKIHICEAREKSLCSKTGFSAADDTGLYGHG